MISIAVVYSAGPRQAKDIRLVMPEGATVEQVLLECMGVFEIATEEMHLVVGVWGRRVPKSHILRENDRVEIYRPLRVDPKIARRERFVRQGPGTTGLFATRRKGAKAGY